MHVGTHACKPTSCPLSACRPIEQRSCSSTSSVVWLSACSSTHGVPPPAHAATTDRPRHRRCSRTAGSSAAASPDTEAVAGASAVADASHLSPSPRRGADAAATGCAGRRTVAWAPAHRPGRLASTTQPADLLVRGGLLALPRRRGSGCGSPARPTPHKGTRSTPRALARGCRMSRVQIEGPRRRARGPCAADTGAGWDAATSWAWLLHGSGRGSTGG
eukprot:361443-Chlamydomonas_euryale.AAC.3